METVNQEQFRELLGRPGATCISIYLPAAEAGEETRSNPTQLKNLLRDARGQMSDLGVSSEEADRLLKPAEDRVDDYPFWQHQGKGLALFLSDDFYREYRLPYSVSPRAGCGNAFYLKPLIPLWAEDARFFILSLSREIIRFYEASPYDLEEIELEGMPRSFAEVHRFEDMEESLQFHSGVPVGRGEQTGIFHGHGSGRDDAKEKLLQFFREIDRGLHAHLRESRAPLVLAGVEYYFPLYREANSYAQLIPEGVPGSPAGWTPDELRDQAWTRLRPHFESLRDEAAETLRLGLSKQQASADIKEVVAAAKYGRVDTCFAALDEQIPGTFNEATGQVEAFAEVHHCAHDLIDLAVVETLSHGGRVFPMRRDQMPVDAPVAAVLRY